MYVGKLLHAKVIIPKLALCKSPANTTNANPVSSTSMEMELISDSQIVTTFMHLVN